MKKFFITLFILVLVGLNAYALEIVYPKSTSVKINAPSTFFIGSTDPAKKLFINENEVEVSSIGAFAHVVPLSHGVNDFTLKSEDNIINYKIERPLPTSNVYVPPVLLEYPVMNNFFVKNEGAPLRMTPVDGGINRMSHLQKNIQLFVNGEKGDFYRVYLNSKLAGWILKTDVEQRQLEAKEVLPVKLKNSKIREDDEFCYYEYDFDKKMLPYVLKEGSGLTLQVFNVENQLDNTFCVNIPLKKILGYEACYDDKKFILKVRKNVIKNCEKPLNNLIIAVDAGHGGAEYGALGGFGDKEKDINLSISKKLRAELENRGAKVVMIRDTDIALSLKDRIKIAKDNNSALLLSIHANALPDGADPIKCRGTSVYYYHNQAKSLAENVLNEMTTQLGTQNDRVRQGSLALVRPTASVSVLVEVAYIINPDDYALLLDSDFQSKCAKAIADGIEKYILH